MRIEVVGEPAELERVAARFAEHDPTPGDLDFLAVLDPLPDGADPSEHWGDKWGTRKGNVVEGTPARFVMQSVSAWAPPMRGFDHVAASWPNLQITVTYDEAGGSYTGTAVWAYGRRVFDRYWHAGRGWIDNATNLSAV